MKTTTRFCGLYIVLTAKEYALFYIIRDSEGKIHRLIQVRKASSSGTTPMLEDSVEYVYDPYGKLLEVKQPYNDSIGLYNPLIYKDYIYDFDTELYYLQSRYYDPEVGRFLNGDMLLANTNNLLGYNIFSYCHNNPIRNYDMGGMIPAEGGGDGWDNYIPTHEIDFNKIINHEVEVYDQGNRPLCWAYSQVMVESWVNGTVLSQSEANVRAKHIAMKYHNFEGWYAGGIPLNQAGKLENNDFITIFEALKAGPIYAIYQKKNVPTTHLLVITGANAFPQEIHTANPQGCRATQSYDEFLNGYVSPRGSVDATLKYCLYIDYDYEYVYPY